MKKIIALSLSACMLFFCGFQCSAEDSLSPLGFVEFISVENASLTFFVSGDGTANIQYTVSATSDTKEMTVKTYIEKRYLGIFWNRVDIGTKNDEWTERTSNRFFVGSHSARLSESGMYRATIEIWIGSDCLIKHAEFKYNKGVLSGDVNSDGRITAADARLLLRWAAGLDRYNSSAIAKFDMNADGRITAADARLVLRISALLN